MRNILILLAITFVTFSCTSVYIKVMDVNDGKLITIRDVEHITKLGDTMVVVVAQAKGMKAVYNHFLYGKYVGKLPENTNTRKFIKCVRIK